MMLIGILLLSITTAYAQEDAPPTVNTQPLEELIPEISALGTVTAVLSPDGEQVVWLGEDAVCYAVIEEGSSTCLPYDGSVIGFAWSPDSRYVAFSENVVIFADEADLWLLDTKASELRNLTDDQYEGNLLQAGELPQDYLPVWNPATGEIYFWRAVRAERGVTMNLYKTTVEGGEPEQVRNLTPRFPTWSVYVGSSQDIFGSTAAISPDGTQMAVLVRGQDLRDPLNGVWLLELEGSSRPEQIAGKLSLASGFAPFHDAERVFPLGVAWTSDGSALVMAAATVDFGWMVLYHLDIETDTLTPFYDFSTLTSETEFFNPAEGSQYAPEFYVPRGMVLLPDDTLLTLNRSDDGLAVLRWSLPPDGEPEFLIPPSEDNGLTQAIVRIPASAGGTRVLITGNMLTLGE